jgi:hypothetical protein
MDHLDHRNRRLVLALAASVGLSAPGCYTVTPQLWESSVEVFTYESTPSKPITITIIDTRSEEPVFRMDIPVGRRLAMQFIDGGGDDPVIRPDRLEWSLLEAGSVTGSLDNKLNVPPSQARRIEYSLRTAPEYPPEPPMAPMRAGTKESQPEWATPDGGSVPTEPRSKRLYQ